MKRVVSLTAARGAAPQAALPAGSPPRTVVLTVQHACGTFLVDKKAVFNGGQNTLEHILEQIASGEALLSSER